MPADSLSKRERPASPFGSIPQTKLSAEKKMAPAKVYRRICFKPRSGIILKSLTGRHCHHSLAARRK
jgi:hypothetical protein